MAYTHATSINKFGVDGLVVATDPANGSHTTLAGALADAVSGQTVFLRDSVVENVTIPPGVNIAGWSGSSLNVSSVSGTITMTSAGTSTISGLRLVTNSAALIAVTGNAASILNVNNCYLDCTNNTGITYSSSSASSEINIFNCKGDLGTTGIGLYAHTSTGKMRLEQSRIKNTGGSTTASNNSAGEMTFSYSGVFFPVTTSSTGSCSFNFSSIDTSAQNTTSFTTAGNASNNFYNSLGTSGSASTLSIGTGTSLNVFCASIISSNTNAITGAGTINITGPISFTTSNIINTSTQTASYTQLGKSIASKQPSFLAYVNTTIPNVTGDGTLYTIIYDTEVYDQGSDFNLGTSTFTAPITGKYELLFQGMIVGGTVISAANLRTSTSNRDYDNAISTTASLTTTVAGSLNVIADMDTGDTAIFQAITTDSGGKVDDINGTSTGRLRNYVSGALLC